MSASEKSLPRPGRHARRNTYPSLNDFSAIMTSIRVSWSKLIRYGEPCREILAVARETKSDLLVMGSVGRTGLSRILMGSVARKVAQEMPCSIVTVKSEHVIRLRLDAEIADMNELTSNKGRVAGAWVSRGSLEPISTLYRQRHDVPRRGKDWLLHIDDWVTRKRRKNARKGRGPSFSISGTDRLKPISAADILSSAEIVITFDGGDSFFVWRQFLCFNSEKCCRFRLGVAAALPSLFVQSDSAALAMPPSRATSQE